MSGLVPRRTLGVHAGSLAMVALALASSHSIASSESIDIKVIPDDLFREMEKMEAEDALDKANREKRVMVITCGDKISPHVFLPEDAKEWKTPNQPFYAKFYREPKGKNRHKKR